MRFVVLLALAALACGGPISPPIGSQPQAAPPLESRIQRPPTNAPPDPIGTARPGNRSCTENRDCRAGDVCFSPDYQPRPAAPAAAAPTCQQDAGCGEGQVCSATGCTATCTPTSCGSGQECRADGHCAAIACTGSHAPVCPLNSRCSPSSGTCDRQRCTTRAECDSGVCFQGRCYAHDAFCAPQSFGTQ
jgi:hypothetical protein